MAELDYDLFVIGAGSAGVRMARMAAARGVKVGLAEYKRLGGTCVNVGCVPKKLLKYASHFKDEFHMSAGYGYTLPSYQFDFARLMQNKDQEIDRLNKIYQGLVERSGCDLFRDKVSFLSNKCLKVGHHTVYAKYIVIAVGGTPAVLDVPGKELLDTSDSFFTWAELPRRTLVVGGGYIAVELASILHKMGSDVTLCHRGDNLLKGFDKPTVNFMKDALLRDDMSIRFKSEVSSLTKTSEGILVRFYNDETAVFDKVLCATGRVPSLDGLNLEKAGVACDKKGYITVDEHFKTSSDGVYALGDVVGRMPLTPVAINEAMCLVDHLYGDGVRRISYDFIPTAIFCVPEIATVGLSEEEARATYDKVKIYQSSFRPMKHTLGNCDEKTLMRMITVGDKEQVIGMHMCGEGAAEIIQGFAVAVRAGLTKACFDATVGIHPTSAEEFVTMRESL